MSKNFVETIIGAIVILVAAWFIVVFASKTGNISVASDNYDLIAKFENADGVSSGSAVKIGGVKIGVITKQNLDPKTYYAILTVSINNGIKIPKDSNAKIVSDGLLGAKYISIIPGGDEAMLSKGEEIKFTQSSVNLESLISKMIFNDDKK